VPIPVRSERLAIRLRPEGERDVIQEAAALAMKRESEWAREVLLDAAQRRLSRAEKESARSDTTDS
jgi:uncharacterized protein (DUF1778 family)